MAPLELEGDTLGEKHKHFNRLVNEALKTNQLLETPPEDDIQNLINIEIASKNHNVDFIQEMLKSEDQLHFSKAIKRSTWLITEPEYAYIINPEHLYSKLSPQMTTKAFNKLMLNIRLHLKDEKRVDAFYNAVKEKNINSAYKWLQHCSVPLIEKEIEKHYNDIPDCILLRLFDKSFTLFEIYIAKSMPCYWITKDCQLLINKHTDKFLDVMENLKDGFHFQLSAKTTKIIMKKCPQRILNKFEFYGRKINLATFAKYLGRVENIKDFLLKYANREKFQWLFAYNRVQYFLKLLPQENRFEFIRKVFIDKDFMPDRISDMSTLDDDRRMQCSIKMCSSINSQSTKTYQWYKFASFDIAFPELKKFIRAESAPEERNLMLQILVTCAGSNMEHIRTILQYYYDKHINEPFKFKIQFVNIFISKVDTHSLDDKTWYILNQLFHSMEVYIESDNNVQSCIKAIIIRNIIRKEQVPDIIQKKFVFDTLKTYHKKLKTQHEKDAVFQYLFEFITNKNKTLNITVEAEFNDSVTFCEHLFNLIHVWDKELRDYPYALDTLKQLTKNKKSNKWSQDLSSMFNINKKWRKMMFEESITILPTEEVCLNALKHEPGLIDRNKEQMLAICCNDTVSLKNLLSKLRIYWPCTIAEEWRRIYLERLDQPGGHKALIVGLCSLLPPIQIKELLQSYAPSETKINWDETDQLKLSLTKQIAKNIHQARPLPPIDGILLYAKGDYLQYAIPSLSSILSQVSSNKSRLHIPLLLDAPVSLQKFGVRCAFNKLTSEEIKPMFSQIWNSTKNSSIRTIIFVLTFKLMCKEKNETNTKNIWDLLSMFIDKLGTDENRLLYITLGEVTEVPKTIQPLFYMKSYTFLSELPMKCNCESIINDMQRKSSDFMEFLDNKFVINTMLKKIMQDFTNERHFSYNSDVLATFILASRDEEKQLQRYQMSLGTIFDKYLPLWNQIDENEYRVKSHIEDILNSLNTNLIYTIKNKFQIPTKTFETILANLEITLGYQKNYLLLTRWKLIAVFVKALKETEFIKEYYTNDGKLEVPTDNDMEKLLISSGAHKQIASQFAKMCVEYIKQDMGQFGSSIYSLFSESLTEFFNSHIIGSSEFECEYYYIKSLLEYSNEREIWLAVYRLLAKQIYYLSSDNDKEKLEEIRTIVFSHPSEEIKMHFYTLFAKVPPYVSTNS